MRAKDARHFDPLPEKRVTIPSLGGDGVVLVRSVGFGEKIQMSIASAEARPGLLLHYCVLDEDGNKLMTPDQWDRYGLGNEEDFLSLTTMARDVSSLNGDEAKKD